MQAHQLAEEIPVVDVDSDALTAARLIADGHLLGLIVRHENDHPYTILPAWHVVQFLVPRYIQADPTLAGVLDEADADKIADKLAGATVGELVGDNPRELVQCRADDTLLEVAALIAREKAPLVAVMDSGGDLVGVITVDKLLHATLNC